MDKELYEKAKRNVLQWRNQVAKQELRDEIEQEVACLKYKSEKLKLTNEIEEELEILERKMKAKPVRCRWDDFARNGYISTIREIRKEGKYHPNSLKWLKSKNRFRR